MKDSTRVKILDYLRISQTATAAEIAIALQISAAGARYHLARLEREGQIEVEMLDLKGDPGRPSQVFRISRSSQPNYFSGLASALLTIQVSQASSGTIDLLWENLARQIAGSHPVSPLRSRRLADCVQALNRMSYQARWEAGAHGPRIFLSNCPYAAIWSRFPGLCQMDRHLLEQWTGQALRQTSRIDLTAPKPRSCIFEGTLGLPASTLQLA